MTRTATAALAALALAGCDADRATPDPNPTASADAAAPVSILRPDIEQPETPVEIPLAPLRMVIPFPEGGAELSEAALAELATVAASPQMEAGGRIVLRGHSDAGGNDAANMRASDARNEAVRDWLVDNGVAEERITAIAFGEQNPAQPNALPDGTPNEAGRKANRRVAVEVLVPSKNASVPADAATQAAGQAEE